MRPIACPEISERNCQYVIRNNAEERTSHVNECFVLNVLSLTQCPEHTQSGSNVLSLMSPGSLRGF